MVEEFPELGSVSFIKCDVEGYELFVFQGATEVIAKSRPAIVLEVGAFESQGYTGKDVSSFFTDLGYTGYALTKTGQLVPVDENLDHPDAVSVNRVLLPEEKKKLLQDVIA
jgi:ATP-dependent protease HslVU (ClpYQ) ATPase subunit